MAQDMSALIAALAEASKTSETPAEATKTKSPIFNAKNITLIILVIAFGFGIYGSFEKAFFKMDDYTKFLETFTWFFAPLVVSIGAGSATKVISSGLVKGKEMLKPTAPTTEEVKK